MIPAQDLRGEPSPPLAVFRADAGPRMGTGHVRRCLALADALADEGWEPAFAVRSGTREAVPELGAGRHRVRELAGDETEEAAALAVSWPGGAELLVVDHYERGADFERRCRPWAERILAVEDLPDRPHEANLLLDTAPGRTATDYRGRVPDDCALLLGPAHSPLRPEFAALRFAQAPIAAPHDPPRILVSLGATDPDNATGAVLAAIEEIGYGGVIDVMLGGAAPHLDAVRALCAGSTLDLRLHVDADDPPAIMSEAGLAIGAAGTSAWERCCLGLPTIMLVLAGNQRANAQALAAAGACVAIDPAADGLAGLAEVLLALIGDRERRTAMARASARLCDGLGARRVAAALRPPLATDGAPVYLRPASETDSGCMYDWQRHPQTRRFARNPAVPARAEHDTWLAGKLGDAGCLFNMIMHGDAPAGVLRLDRQQSGDGFVVSILIDPDRYRLGLASAALRLARRLVPFAMLHALVMPGNTASARLFERAGYAPAEDGWYVNAPEPEDPVSTAADVGASQARGH